MISVSPHFSARLTATRRPFSSSAPIRNHPVFSSRKNGETTMVTPAASFYKTPGKGINHVRIAYVLEVEELKKAMNILAKGLEAYPGRTI